MVAPALLGAALADVDARGGAPGRFTLDGRGAEADALGVAAVATATTGETVGFVDAGAVASTTGAEAATSAVTLGAARESCHPAIASAAAATRPPAAA